MNTTAQEMQDEIFRNMTVEQKLEVWVGLWRLAKDLTDNKCLSCDKINYGANRSKGAS